jgi:hypothetical protein
MEPKRSYDEQRICHETAAVIPAGSMGFLRLRRPDQETCMDPPTGEKKEKTGFQNGLAG